MLLVKPFTWALDSIPSHAFNDIVPAILFFLHYKSSPFLLAKSNWLAKNAVLSSNLIKSTLTVIFPLLFSFYTAKLMERVVCVNQGSGNWLRARFSLCLFFMSCELIMGFTFLIGWEEYRGKDKGRRTRRKAAATVTICAPQSPKFYLPIPVIKFIVPNFSSAFLSLIHSNQALAYSALQQGSYVVHLSNFIFQYSTTFFAPIQLTITFSLQFLNRGWKNWAVLAAAQHKRQFGVQLS